MSQYKYAEIADTVYFWFAANTTAGAAGDGATPLYDVRLAGALAGAIPTASGTPTLLTHANYTDGLHEIAIDTTGYAAGEYAVFCTLTISTVNPAGFCGSFKLRTAGTAALGVNVVAQANIDFGALQKTSLNAATPASVQNINAQTGDSFARLGAPIAASISADIAVVDANVDTLLTRITAAVYTAWTKLADVAMAGTEVAGSLIKRVYDNLDAAISSRSTYAGGAVASVTGAVGSVTGAVGSVTAGVTVTTNNDKAGYGLSAAAVQAIWDALTSALTTVGSIGKKLADWVVGTIDTYTGNTKQTADHTANIAAILADTGTDGVVLPQAQADKVWGSAARTLTSFGTLIADIFGYVVENGKTFLQYVRIKKSGLAGKSAGGGTNTITFRDDADIKPRITATVDANGNRTAVTVDGT